MTLKSSLASSTAVPTPDLSALPAHIDRRQAAEIITRYFFPVSRRSLERWPVTVRHLNGRAVSATAEYVELARAKFDAAPLLATGRRGD